MTHGAHPKRQVLVYLTWPRCGSSLCLYCRSGRLDCKDVGCEEFYCGMPLPPSLEGVNFYRGERIPGLRLQAAIRGAEGCRAKPAMPVASSFDPRKLQGILIAPLFLILRLPADPHEWPAVFWWKHSSLHPF